MSRKEWCKTISFVAIFLALLIMVSYIVRTNGFVKDRFAGFYAEDKNSIDVMMFGGSTVGTSFSPGLLWGEYGITAYPLSSNTQRPKSIRYLLEEAYHYQSPEVVLIELRMFTYEDEKLKRDEPHIREVTDNLRYSFRRLKTVYALTDGIDSFEERLSYYFDIIKYHSNWGMFFQKKEWKHFNYRNKDLHKGFEHLEKSLYLDDNIAPYVKAEKRIPIPNEQERELRNLMQFLKEKNQKAVFVVTPCIYGEEYYAKMNYMKDLVESEGFSYLNIHEYTNHGLATDYYDGGHSNILGAKKCTEVLGNFLKDTFNMQNHRKNVELNNGTKIMDTSWEKSYQAFLDVYNDVNSRKEEER